MVVASGLLVLMGEYVKRTENVFTFMNQTERVNFRHFMQLCGRIPGVPKTCTNFETQLCSKDTLISIICFSLILKTCACYLIPYLFAFMI